MICMRLANCPEWIWRRDRSLWHSNLWYRNQNLRCNADDNIFAWVNLDHYLICQLYRTKKNIINRGNTRSDTGYFFYFNIANSNISLKSAYIEFGARQSRMLDVRKDSKQVDFLSRIIPKKSASISRKLVLQL